MKTKLLFIALAFALMSSTCSPEEQTQSVNDCSCQKVHYERQQTGWQGSAPVYTFVEVGRETATDADCNTAVTEYTNDGTGHWYKIICE